MTLRALCMRSRDFPLVTSHYISKWSEEEIFSVRGNIVTVNMFLGDSGFHVKASAKNVCVKYLNLSKKSRHLNYAKKKSENIRQHLIPFVSREVITRRNSRLAIRELEIDRPISQNSMHELIL